MPSKLPRVRTAILAGLAALSLGGVAAATGLSPASAERATQAASGSSAATAAASANGAAATLVHGPDAAGAAGKASDHATGPDASGAAKAGLCQAWAAGQGDDHGQRADAPAFQALADAAGGADQIAAYCADETATAASHGNRPATPPDGDDDAKPTPLTTGPPASPGGDHGQGGPPTTG